MPRSLSMPLSTASLELPVVSLSLGSNPMMTLVRYTAIISAALIIVRIVWGFRLLIFRGSSVDAWVNAIVIHHGSRSSLSAGLAFAVATRF